jgi:hypothetical protein
MRGMEEEVRKEVKGGKKKIMGGGDERNKKRKRVLKGCEEESGRRGVGRLEKCSKRDSIVME